MNLYLIYLREDKNKVDPRYDKGHFGRWTNCHKLVRNSIKTGDIVIFLQGQKDKVHMEFATEVYVDGGYGLNWDPSNKPYDLKEAPIFSITMAKKIRPKIEDKIDTKLKKGKSKRQIIGNHFRNYGQPFNDRKAEIILEKYKLNGNRIGKKRIGRAYPGKSEKKC